MKLTRTLTAMSSALLLALGLLGFQGHVQQDKAVAAERPVVCQTKVTEPLDRTLTMGPVARPRLVSVIASATVKYKRCINRLGPDYVDPTSVRVSIYQSGRAHCDKAVVGGYSRVKTSTYFIQPNGKLFKGPTLSNPCVSRPWVVVNREYSAAKVPNLYPLKIGGRIKSPNVRMTFTGIYDKGNDDTASGITTMKF